MNEVYLNHLINKTSYYNKKTTITVYSEFITSYMDFSINSSMKEISILSEYARNNYFVLLSHFY